MITSEPIRQAQGLTQLLTTESRWVSRDPCVSRLRADVFENSRRLHADLTTPPPLLRPFDWKRSRVRREHLISLGIPVNLDEVSAPSTSLLPPLKITTLQAASEVTPRPVSATFTSKDRELPKRSSSAGPGPSSLAKRQTRNGGEESSLGERPEFNAEKAKRLLDYREGELAQRGAEHVEKLTESNPVHLQTNYLWFHRNTSPECKPTSWTPVPVHRRLWRI